MKRTSELQQHSIFVFTSEKGFCPCRSLSRNIAVEYVHHLFSQFKSETGSLDTLLEHHSSLKSQLEWSSVEGWAKCQSRPYWIDLLALYGHRISKHQVSPSTIYFKSILSKNTKAKWWFPFPRLLMHSTKTVWYNNQSVLRIVERDTMKNDQCNEYC